MSSTAFGGTIETLLLILRTTNRDLASIISNDVSVWVEKQIEQYPSARKRDLLITASESCLSAGKQEDAIDWLIIALPSVSAVRAALKAAQDCVHRWPLYRLRAQSLIDAICYTRCWHDTIPLAKEAKRLKMALSKLDSKLYNSCELYSNRLARAFRQNTLCKATTLKVRNGVKKTNSNQCHLNGNCQPEI
jgi:hypothetical protein